MVIVTIRASTMMAGIHFFLVFFVEKHIEIANQVVALFAGLLRSDIVAPLDPSQHRFAILATVVFPVPGFPEKIR